MGNCSCGRNFSGSSKRSSVFIYSSCRQQNGYLRWTNIGVRTHKFCACSESGRNALGTSETAGDYAVSPRTRISDACGKGHYCVWWLQRDDVVQRFVLFQSGCGSPFRNSAICADLLFFRACRSNVVVENESQESAVCSRGPRGRCVARTPRTCCCGRRGCAAGRALWRRLDARHDRNGVDRAAPRGDAVCALRTCAVSLSDLQPAQSGATQGTRSRRRRHRGHSRRDTCTAGCSSGGEPGQSRLANAHRHPCITECSAAQRSGERRDAVPCRDGRRVVCICAAVGCSV